MRLHSSPSEWSPRLGQEFYAEVSDTYSQEDCSDFCRREVLPHLEGGAVKRPLKEVRVDLCTWLEAMGGRAVLVCDSARDIRQLRRMFLFPAGTDCR